MANIVEALQRWTDHTGLYSSIERSEAREGAARKLQRFKSGVVRRQCLFSFGQEWTSLVIFLRHQNQNRLASTGESWTGSEIRFGGSRYIDLRTVWRDLSMGSENQ